IYELSFQVLPGCSVDVSALSAICFQREYLVVVRTDTLPPVPPPIVDVVGHGDRVVRLGGRSAPVVFILPERSRADDRRFVHTLKFIKAVRMSVAADRVDLCSAGYI